jgi:simple sugar transport system ATP-binding protein
VTVLRDGRVVGRVKTADTNQKELARMMVGRDVITHWDKPATQAGTPVLKIDNLSVSNDKGMTAVRDLSLEVREGEILGIAGVSGNGQRELAESIAGMRRASAGTIWVCGKNVTNQSPAQVMASGTAFIPEERMTMGVVREFSVSENAILETHAQPPLANRGVFNFAKINEHCIRLVREYDVKTPSLDTPVKSLSGGNIQKLILARELDRAPRLLLAAQPTRGVDIGATEYIHRRLLEQRATGTAILLISEDLEEVRALSDRIAVMYEGQIVGIVPPDSAMEDLGLMMAGAKRTGTES